MPLCVDCPKVAWRPVIEPYSPMGISLPETPVFFPAAPPSFGGQPTSMSERAAIARTTKDLFFISFHPFLLLVWPSGAIVAAEALPRANHGKGGRSRPG